MSLGCKFPHTTSGICSKRLCPFQHSFDYKVDNKWNDNFAGLIDEKEIITDESDVDREEKDILGRKVVETKTDILESNLV